MLNWLRSLFTRQGDFGRLDVYYPRERQIFVYWNGNKWIKSDPMVLYKKVMDVGPELSIDIKVMSSPVMDAKGAKKAHCEMIAKLRSIFDVKIIEEEGLTEPEVEELYIQFMEYNDWLKKNFNPTPTASTETSPPSQPSSEKGPAINNSMASSSILNVPGTDGPGPSVTGSPSPTSK